MTLRPLKSPAVFSVVCGYALLLVASFLPIWRLGMVGPSSHSSTGTIWAGVNRLVYFKIGLDQFFGYFAYYHRNIVVAVSLFTLGVCLGRLGYWNRWERLLRQTP